MCRELDRMRRRTDELTARRDVLVAELRDGGISGIELAQVTGLTAGRITQIVMRVEEARARRRG